jgi:hypothetical protein
LRYKKDLEDCFSDKLNFRFDVAKSSSVAPPFAEIPRPLPGLEVGVPIASLLPMSKLLRIGFLGIVLTWIGHAAWQAGGGVSAAKDTSLFLPPALLPPSANAAASAKASAKELKFRAALAELSSPLQNPTVPFNEENIRPLLKALSVKESRELEQRVLDPSADGNERRTALFILTRAGAPAIPALVAISRSAIPEFENSTDPHSLDSLRMKNEISLRVTAIEALDQQSISNPDISAHLFEIAQIQKNPTLEFLVRISLAGIAEGRPGKLGRAIDAMIQEKSL